VKNRHIAVYASKLGYAKIICEYGMAVYFSSERSGITVKPGSLFYFMDREK